jgi:hypothetical protein
MSQSKAEELVARLLANAAGLRFGSVSVTVKVHNGRIVEALYATTQNIRDEQPQEKADNALTGAR